MMALQLHATASGLTSDRHPNPLLFVHGAWHASWCWEENFVPYFVGEGYSCNAFDFRGHGESEGRERLNEYGLEDFVDDLSRQVKELQRPPVLIAHSMGGLVTQRYAQSHPVKAVVLLAPIPLNGVGYAYARMHPIPFLKLLLTRNGFSMIGGEKLARSLLFSPELPQVAFQKYYGKLQAESYKALLDIGKGIERKPLEGNPPLLMIEAGNDAVISPKRLADTAEFYGNDLVILKSIAHDVMLDVNWRKAGELIDAWLKKNGI